MANNNILVTDVINKKNNVISQVNNTDRPLPYNSLGSLLEKSGKENENSPAILMSDRVLTYKEVIGMAKSIAKKLSGMKIGRNDSVALIFDKGYEQVVSVLGVIYAGAAYTPIDSTFPCDLAKNCLDSAESCCIITTKENHEKYKNIGINVLVFEELINDNDVWSMQPVKTKPDDLFAVIFTSGSTGKPKGVMLEQKGVHNCFIYTNERFSLDQNDRLFSVTDLCHDMCIYEMIGLLLVGGGIVMPSVNERRDIGKWIELINKYSVTFWSSVPTFMEMLLVYAEGIKDVNITIPSLKNVLLGGGFMKLSIYDRLKSIAENVELYNIGGPTETTMWNIMHKVTREDIINEKIPYGRPIWNTQYHILNDNLEYVDINEIGVIYNSGIGVAKGYTDEKLTQELFFFHETIKQRMYKTGDLGYYNENGEIEIVGRSDLQIKINGKRIELEEIEFQLKKDSRVAEAAVVATKNEKIHAFIETKTSKENEVKDTNLWKDVFDNAYKNNLIRNKVYDFSGWRSSYTWEQIPDEEMMEWLDNTSKRILKSNPKNILEIGCGTGLIMYKIISEIDFYIGIDLSEIAINKLKKDIEANDNIRNKANVFQGSADDLNQVKGKKFDTIIINSVIMFFASEEYLTNVINECLELLTDNGVLFIGDIIDNNLLEVFRTSVNYYQTNEKLVSDLKKKIEQDCKMVKDLLVSPQYFERILAINSQIRGIEIKLKDMESINEVSKFRYDAIIYKGLKRENLASQIVGYDQKCLDSDIENLLKKGHNSFVIRNVPNQFIDEDIYLTQTINSFEETKSISELKEKMTEYKNSSLLPKEYYVLGEKYGYRCAVKNVGSEYMEVLYSKDIPFNVEPKKNEHKERVNVPYKLSDDKFMQELKLNLKGVLPGYMIPSYIDVVEKLPYLSNGKVDRESLTKIANERTIRTNENIETNTLSDECKNTWCRVLNIDDTFELEASFWELGGHSLLALQLLNLIKEEYQCDISLTQFFSNPTLKYINQCVEAVTDNSPHNKTEQKKIIYSENYETVENDTFELSELQQAYLIARESKLPFTKIATHCYLELTFSDFSMESFVRAVDKLVKKHDMLRCYFTDDGNQVILDELESLPITSIDVSELDYDDYNDYFVNKRKEMNLNNIDYHVAPLFKLHVSQRGDNAIVHFYYDGLIMDGYSKNIFLRDLDYYYGGGVDEANAQKKIGKFKHYIKNYNANHNNEIAKEFWMQRIDNLPSMPSIPINEEYNTYSNIDSVQYRTVLDIEDWNTLKKIAKTKGLTNFSVLLTAFCKVISRWSKEQDFLINVPLIDRNNNYSDSTEFIGETASFLLFDFYNSKESFVDLAKKNQGRLYKLIENREFTGIDILREMSQRTGNVGTGVVPIVFTSLIDIPEITEKNYSCSYFESYTSQVWMDAIASLTKNGVEFTWDCRKGIFDNEMIVSVQNAFVDLLVTLANNVEVWGSECYVSLPSRDIDIINNINDTEHEVGRKCIGQLIDEVVDKYAYNIAAIEDEKEYTYMEIGKKVKSLYLYLQQQGINVSDSVAVMLEKGHEQLVVALGISYAGAAYAPIEYDLPIERVKQALKDIDAKVAITNSKKINVLREELDVVCVDINCITQYEEFKDVSPKIQEDNDIFAVIFTSGSTGKPKGVYIKSKGIINCLEFTNQYLNITEEDRILSVTNICHDMSIYDLYGFFISGGTVVFPTADKSKDPKYWKELINKHRVTFWESVPTMMEMLLIELESNGLEDNELNSLQKIVLGGEFLKIPLCNKIKKYANNACLYNIGGPTETTLWNIFHKVNKTDVLSNHIPYGRPIWNTKYYILNDLLEIVPVGVPGTIYNSGMGVAKGYTDAKSTEDKFIEHPELGVRLYNTGDLGRYTKQGEIDILGREDSQVKINGKRIELEEIRSCLSRYQEISEVAVKYEREIKQLVAFYVAEKEISKKILSEYLLEYLPNYMVPSIYQKINELPTLPNGKLDYSKLIVLAKDNDKESVNITYSEFENAIFEIVKKHLQVQMLDVYDNFFMAGGDSLKALKIVSEINSSLHLDINITDILLSKSINSFIGIIHEDNIECENIKAESNWVYAPLSFAQEGVWFDCISKSTNHFIVPCYIDITGAINVRRLEEALNKAADKYSIVKTSILVNDEFNPYQTIIQNRAIHLEYRQITALNEDEKQRILNDFEKKSLITTMEIDKDFLCRFTIFNVGENQYRLYALFHHIIVDDMSIKIFMKEVFYNYFGYIDCDTKDYTQMYFKYCKRDKEYKFSEADKTYLKQLISRGNYLKIPNSKDLSNITYEGKNIRFELGRKEMQEFHEKCAMLNASINIGFLAVYAMMLHRVSNDTNVSIGMPFSSRNAEEANMIGLLVNLELVCLDVDCDDSFESVLQRIKENVFNYINKKYPPYVELCRLFKASRESMMIPHHIVYNYLEDERITSDGKLMLSPITYVNNQVRHNLGLLINNSKDTCYGEFTYNINYIDDQIAETVKNAYLDLFYSIINE